MSSISSITVNALVLNKGSTFLKKLCCCFGTKYYKIIWFWADNVNWAPERYLEADLLSASPSLERIEELWVVCVTYIERWLVRGK